MNETETIHVGQMRVHFSPYVNERRQQERLREIAEALDFEVRRRKVISLPVVPIAPKPILVPQTSILGVAVQPRISSQELRQKRVLSRSHPKPEPLPVHACAACGDEPAAWCHKRKDWLCVDCLAEVERGVVPAMELVTSRFFHIPAGVSLRRCSRVPGVGDGRDYNGNHT